ncbi:hypothetical protein [Phytohabitans suffuscus]|nr:hypothetical protein [Phytohabitans suffuscus]
MRLIVEMLAAPTSFAGRGQIRFVPHWLLVIVRLESASCPVYHVDFG